jgi:hypothetical protein
MRNLTPRGWLVLVAFGLLALWGLWLVSARLWWVGVGEVEADLFGWCWGTMAECVKL